MLEKIKAFVSGFMEAFKEAIACFKKSIRKEETSIAPANDAAPDVPRANEVKRPKKESWINTTVKQAVTKIKGFITDAIENPVKFVAVGGAIATAATFVFTCIDKAINVRERLERRRDAAMRQYDYYDNRTGQHLMLNRPLSPEQINAINLAREQGIPAATYIKNMGYLAGF